MNPHGPAGGQDRGEGPASSSSQQGSASSSTPTKEERTPRPPNAWILYRSFKSQELKDQQELEFGPQRSKPRSQAEVSRIVSAMWKSERPEVRQQFELIAKERKRQHQESFPGYRYRPRRPPRTGAPQRASSSRKSDPARDYSGESGASSSMHPSSPSGEGSDPVLQSPSLYERGDPGLCSSMLASTDSQGDALGRFDTLAGHGFSDKDLNVSPAHATQASLALATDMSGALAQHGKPHAGFGLVNDHRQPNPFRPLPRAGSGSQQFRADTTTGDPSSALASLSDDGWSRFAHTSASSSSAVATTTSGTALLYQDMRTADSLLRSSSNPSRIQRHDSFTNPPQGAMPMNTFDHFVQFERITSPERETDLRRSPHFYLPPHGSDSDAMASFVPHFPAVQSHGTGREQSWQPQPQSHSTFSSSPPQQSRFASIVLSPPAQQRAKPTFPGDLGASSLASGERFHYRDQPAMLY